MSDNHGCQWCDSRLAKLYKGWIWLCRKHTVEADEVDHWLDTWYAKWLKKNK